jgi:hypothetical protein
MGRSRKIFIICTVVFFLILAYVSYDFSTRTTFPGSKKPLKETIEKEKTSRDSVSADSIHH